jgi:hypothetical protein
VNAERPIAAADAQPFLPLAFNEHVALIRAGPAIDAFVRRRAGQMVTHGHTPESDLARSIGFIANEARWRLAALHEIVGPNRMNLPPGRREQCVRYIESAGGILISLWDRVHTEVPEE